MNNHANTLKPDFSHRMQGCGDDPLEWTLTSIAVNLEQLDDILGLAIDHEGMNSSPDSTLYSLINLAWMNVKDARAIIKAFGEQKRQTS